MMRPKAEIAAPLAMEVLEEAAECLRTIAHPHRLRMIQLLVSDRYTVGELAEACGIPSSAASGHLRLLKDRGFLDLDREGRSVYYRIVEPHLRSILGCIESRFGCGLTGEATAESSDDAGGMEDES